MGMGVLALVQLKLDINAFMVIHTIQIFALLYVEIVRKLVLKLAMMEIQPAMTVVIQIVQLRLDIFVVEDHQLQQTLVLKFVEMGRILELMLAMMEILLMVMAVHQHALLRQLTVAHLVIIILLVYAQDNVMDSDNSKICAMMAI